MLPLTARGRLSLVTLGLFFAFLGIVAFFVAAGEQGGEGFFSNLKLSLPMAAAVLSAAISFISGVISVAKDKERSMLVFAAIVLSLLPLIFVVGELLMP